MHNSFVPIDILPEKTSENLAWLEAQRAKGYDVTVSCLSISRSSRFPSWFMSCYRG
jgi:hypothetical protein